MNLRNERWMGLWERLGLGGRGEETFRRLEEAYASPPRAYHDLGHVDETLDAFDEMRSLAEDGDAVQMALWFHDAIYDPRERDNEARSARLALDTLVRAGLGLARCERIHDLILATRLDARPAGPDEAVVVDADMAILGRGEDRYWAYEVAIRQEYGWVDEIVFRRERARILRSFLAREWIYRTSVARERYEARARANLKGSLGRLEDGTPTAPRG